MDKYKLAALLVESFPENIKEDDDSTMAIPGSRPCPVDRQGLGKRRDDPSRVGPRTRMRDLPNGRDNRPQRNTKPKKTVWDKPLDQTIVPGELRVVNGQLVDKNGNPVESMKASVGKIKQVLSEYSNAQSAGSIDVNKVFDNTFGAIGRGIKKVDDAAQKYVPGYGFGKRLVGQGNGTKSVNSDNSEKDSKKLEK